MRALLTGATGFIGPHLLAHLNQPVVLSRDADRVRQVLAKFDIESYGWDPMAGPPRPEVFEGIDTVFHLAGDPVAEGRWTEKKKKRILDSRVVGTRNLVEGLRRLTNRPRVLVSASAVGYYGSRGDEVLDESAVSGEGFLVEVCTAWEREAQAAAEFGMRVASVRVGIVLGREGGALKRMLTPFRLGVGGPLGNGRQWMPWIHVDDLAAMFMHAAERTEVTGPINGVSPNPVTNKEFTTALAAAVHRPAFLPTPYFALRVALGEFAKILFDSQRVVPRKALATGFQFRFPEIGPAMEAILSK
jgi:uncharacterized protein (TIGR01777 family)